MKPIKVNKLGESLGGHPSFDDWNDGHRITGALPLQHLICGGITRRQRVEERTDVIFCGCCGLRVLIPKSIKTIGELRKHFKQFDS